MTRRPGSRRGRRLAVTAAAVLLTGTGSARAATVNLFPVPSPAAGLQEIVNGPDGNLWVTEQSADRVARVTPGGQVTEFPMPLHQPPDGDDIGPDQITSSGGDLWFLEDTGATLDKLVPGAATPTVVVPYNRSDNFDNLVPDGAGGVWTITQLGDQLADYTASGALGATPAAQATGQIQPIPMLPDGAGGVWYSDDTTTGSYLRHQPGAGTPVSYPANNPEPVYYITSLAADAAGDLWFTGDDPGTGYTPAEGGEIGELPVGGASATTVDLGYDSGIVPHSMVLGPDGALWFATNAGVGRLVPGQPIGPGNPQYATLGGYHITDMAFGSDGNLWFVDTDANDVGEIVTGTVFPPPAPAPTPTPTPTPTPAPTTKRPLAPTLSVRIPSTTLRAIGRRRGLVVQCRLDGAGRCAASVAVTARDARRLGVTVRRHARTVTLARAARTLKKRGTARLTLHLRRTVARRIAHRPRLALRVTVRSTKSGHRPRTVHRRLTLHR